METSGLRKGTLFPLLIFLRAASAYSATLLLDQTWANHQKCIDMRGNRPFGPEKESSLILNFQQSHEGVVSIVTFELGDEHLGGIRDPLTNEVSRLMLRSVSSRKLKNVC